MHHNLVLVIIIITIIKKNCFLKSTTTTIARKSNGVWRTCYCPWHWTPPSCTTVERSRVAAGGARHTRKLHRWRWMTLLSVCQTRAQQVVAVFNISSLPLILPPKKTSFHMRTPGTHYLDPPPTKISPLPKCSTLSRQSF